MGSQRDKLTPTRHLKKHWTPCCAADHWASIYTLPPSLPLLIIWQNNYALQYFLNITEAVLFIYRRRISLLTLISALTIQISVIFSPWFMISQRLWQQRSWSQVYFSFCCVTAIVLNQIVEFLPWRLFQESLFKGMQTVVILHLEWR